MDYFKDKTKLADIAMGLFVGSFIVYGISVVYELPQIKPIYVWVFIAATITKFISMAMKENNQKETDD